MDLSTQYILNRGFIYEPNNDEPIGETNFCVSGDWFEHAYDKLYANSKLFDNINDFLDTYEPLAQGEELYQLAVKENALIHDYGEVVYEEEDEILYGIDI